MPSKHDRRMRLLESHATTIQRRTLAGLVALVESGQLPIAELTDAELDRLLALGPGADVDLQQFSDEELEAIINGELKRIIAEGDHGHN